MLNLNFVINTVQEHKLDNICHDKWSLVYQEAFINKNYSDSQNKQASTELKFLFHVLYLQEMSWALYTAVRQQVAEG